MDSIENTIRKFIVEEIMFNNDECSLAFDELLLQNGIIDSMGLQMLVPFIESEFSISVPDNELVPENFETIQTIGILVERIKKVM